MNTDPLLDRLNRVKSLLEHPQPGLYSWLNMYSEALTGLCAELNRRPPLAIREGEWQTVRKVSERDELRESMCHLAHDLNDVRVELVRATEVLRSASGFATKQDLEKLGDKIMSAIGDWGTKVGPKLDRIQSGLDAVQALVEKLQNTPGAITPEDQAILDQIEAKVDAIASDADSIPPVPPVTTQ